MAKIQPAQRTLIYSGTPSSGALTLDIDLARDLSAVNRRLYRQGYQYFVQSVEMVRADTGLSLLQVQTAGDTWMVHNAWKKGYHLWRDQVHDVTETLPSIEGKWADFKVKLDDASGTLAVPLAGDMGGITGDEWNLSQFFWDNDGTEQVCTFNLLGASDITSEASLVQEYHISRGQPSTEPTVPVEAADSMYAKSLFVQDELSEDIIDEINADNDNAPYDMSEMVGGDTVADAPFTQDLVVASIAQKAMTAGFTAECGLLRVNISSVLADGSTASDVLHIVKVNLAPGPYKGVMAAPMGQ